MSYLEANQLTMTHFNPPRLLRNPHIQSVLNSIKLRRPLVIRRSKNMLNAAASHILDCDDGVRLQGYFSGHNPGQKDLCILIHGWMGSSESSYLLSAAGTLWNQGFDIFRLNMRDHGLTHHLNKGLFHSCRINEVVGAIQRIQEMFPHKRLFLTGFSLGGNFALRVAVRAPSANIKLDKVIAICPVLYPPNTLLAMENGLQIYHMYFMKKWRESLRIKRKYFPRLKGLERISGFQSISDMTDYFVKHFTDYPDMMTYLKGYGIIGQALENLEIPSTIIASRDDPIIPSKDLHHLAAPDCLNIITTQYGGHCGYFKDYHLTSWAEQQLKGLLKT